MQVAGATLAVCALLLATIPSTLAAEDGSTHAIAGLAPHERPVGAPFVSEVIKDEGWYSRALHGVSEPYPPSLGFLDNQGNWYTPFTRPGMPGRYDIRGLHVAQPLVEPEKESIRATAIAGLTPHQRPADAPMINEVIRDEGWSSHALRGVSEPYPPSLGFLDNQGNWYTPFTRPGMPGRYDIRGLHAPES